MKRPFPFERRRVISRPLAIRMATVLAVVLLATGVWWQVQVQQAIAAANVGPASADQCEDLEETNDLVLDGNLNASDVNKAALRKRLQACAD